MTEIGDNNEDWPTKCPRCGGKKLKDEKQSEYTGGGYADYWYELQCKACNFIWRLEKKTSYF